jgi:DNA-binding response OmpR family regulator
VLSLDTQQNATETGRNGSGRSTNAKAQMSELIRVLGGGGEMARILIVEESEQMALLVGEAFSGENTTVRMARNHDQARDECLAFHPHLLVFNVALPNNEALRLVGWLRDRDVLTHLVLVAYSGRGLASSGAKSGMEPTTLLKRARVQPEELEQLVLTILRGSRHIESAAEVAGVSGVTSA